MSNMYGVEHGQVYVAADNGKYGHLVVDAVTYAHCDDVVVQPFTAKGFDGEPRRIDTFKLARVRYSLVDTLPEWAAHLQDVLRPPGNDASSFGP